MSDICLTCKCKNVCKHYAYARETVELTISISNCDNYISNAPTQGAVALGTVTESAIDSLDKIVKERVYEDFKLVDTITPNITVEEIEVSKEECEICKNLFPVTKLTNCHDCGKLVCESHVYGITNPETKGIEMVCDICFGDNPNNPQTTTEDGWDLENFITEEDGDKDVKRRRSSKTKSSGPKKSHSKK